MNQHLNKQMRLLLSKAELSRDAIINVLDLLNEITAAVEAYYFSLLQQEKRSQ